MTERLAMQELLLSGNANVQVSVNSKDLCDFGEAIVKKAIEAMTKEKKEVMLKVNEAAKKLNVDRSTLYRWEQSGYLRPVRVGGMPRYRLSDIEAIINK